jgi:hypothetical protein
MLHDIEYKQRGLGCPRAEAHAEYLLGVLVIYLYLAKAE